MNKSIDFENFVDLADENEGREEADSAEHNEEVIAKDQHVSKIKECLQCPRHLWTIPIVKEGVCIDEYPSGTSRKERSPPPLMIFHGKLEISQGNGDASSHDQQ